MKRWKQSAKSSDSHAANLRGASGASKPREQQHDVERPPCAQGQDHGSGILSFVLFVSFHCLFWRRVCVNTPRLRDTFDLWTSLPKNKAKLEKVYLPAPAFMSVRVPVVHATFNSWSRTEQSTIHVPSRSHAWRARSSSVLAPSSDARSP